MSPPLLVGRDPLLEEFTEALEDGPGSSGRAVLFTGARGCGKTVMLNAVEDAARERGWLFLLAMARDDGPSRMADVQERLGVDGNYARRRVSTGCA